MKIKAKIEKSIQNVIDKVTNSGVSQEENRAYGEKEVFGNMPELIRKASAESIVLLKNNNTLPYNEQTRLAIFGRCQIDYFYVGYGSGGDIHAPYVINLAEAMKNNGAVLNEELLSFYKKWSAENPINHGFWGHWPMCYEEAELDEALVSRCAQDSTDALVVIGRAAGEDRENKLIKGSYYLNDNEIKLLDTVVKYFKKVTVVMNCSNIIDMSWTKRYGDRITAIVYAWQGGMESTNALSDVLYGRENPSGRLADTIAVKYSDYPSAENFGKRSYNNYSEDIFVGYRYFESFCRDKALYPFGFGLSYTDFSLECTEYFKGKDFVKIKARVKNIGDAAGKDTVQIYFSAPQGKLSKPKLSLLAFGKTKLLESGEEQELEFEIPLYSLASFDDIGKTGNKFSYILEQGEYKFFAGRNVRELVDAGAFTLQSSIVLETLDEICAVQNPFERITARVSHGELIPVKEWVDKSQPYLKKRIEENLPKEIGFKGAKNYTLQDVADGKISLDDFISTLTNEELEALTRGQGYMDSELGVSGNAGALGGVIQSLRDKGVPPVITTDGPAGIRINSYTSLLPCGTALACTWNTELVEELCTELGRELVYRKSDILLAPGMNIHRDPLCGRNFEYFSEDPVLTGKMAAAYVRGVQSHGASACPKHFACNNQEVNRTHNDSRVSQRALREIYLKGFEICVKESKPVCIMTSYNKINGVWSHYNYDLAAVVLRKEWGFDGLVMTDWWMRSSKSEQFPNIRDNAYRVRSQVDVLMPGGKKRVERSYKSDGTLLETVGTRNGFTRAEIERTAKCVLSVVIKLKLSNK